MTLKQSRDLFLLSAEVGCKEKTVKYYQENVDRFCRIIETYKKKIAAEIDMREITKDDFQKFVVDLREHTKPDGSPIKNSSVRTYCRAVKVFMNYCGREGHIELNCTNGVKLPKDDSSLQIPLYKKEVVIIDRQFSTKTETGLRNLCIIHLMLDAGLRAGEVIGLNLENVKFDQNFLYVVRSKSENERVVPLCQKLKQYLAKYLILYRNVDVHHSSYAQVYRGQCLIKQVKTDKRITENVVKLLFSRLKFKTGIERLHAHLCRHTFATSYLMGGGNLEMLRMLMGHCDYAVTQTYVELAAQFLMMGAEIYELDPVFFKTAY